MTQLLTISNFLTLPPPHFLPSLPLPSVSPSSSLSFSPKPGIKFKTEDEKLDGQNSVVSEVKQLVGDLGAAPITSAPVVPMPSVPVVSMPSVPVVPINNMTPKTVSEPVMAPVPATAPMNIADQPTTSRDSDASKQITRKRTSNEDIKKRNIISIKKVKVSDGKSLRSIVSDAEEKGGETKMKMIAGGKTSEAKTESSTAVGVQSDSGLATPSESKSGTQGLISDSGLATPSDSKSGSKGLISDSGLATPSDSKSGLSGAADHGSGETKDEDDDRFIDVNDTNREFKWSAMTNSQVFMTKEDVINRIYTASFEKLWAKLQVAGRSPFFKTLGKQLPADMLWKLPEQSKISHIISMRIDVLASVIDKEDLPQLQTYLSSKPDGKVIYKYIADKKMAKLEKEAELKSKKGKKVEKKSKKTDKVGQSLIKFWKKFLRAEVADALQDMNDKIDKCTMVLMIQGMGEDERNKHLAPMMQTLDGVKMRDRWLASALSRQPIATSKKFKGV